MSAGVSVAGTVVHFAEAVKLLGVTLDPVFSTSNGCGPRLHVPHARTASYQTARYSPLLPRSRLPHSIVGARLDYCNSLLYRFVRHLGCNLDRLQRVQNQLTRVVLQAPWTASATDLRRQLHWLPIRQRIAFKLAAVAYKTRQSGIPEYLHCDIRDYQPCITLRSTSALLLQQPPAP